MGSLERVSRTRASWVELPFCTSGIGLELLAFSNDFSWSTATPPTDPVGCPTELLVTKTKPIRQPASKLKRRSLILSI